MATPGTGAPPTAPQIARQQRGVSQYGQTAVAQGATPNDPTGGAGGPGGSSADFVKTQLSKIAQLMSQVAKVVQVSRPELMPLMQRMAGAGQTLEQELAKGGGGDQGGGPSVPQDAPQGNPAPSDEDGNPGA